MAAVSVPRWLWMVLVAAHLITLGWAIRTGSWDFPDSGRYQQAAANIAQHGQLYARAWPLATPLGQAVQEFSIRTPGYPVVILGLGAAQSHIALLLVIQNLLSLATIGVVLHWWAGWARPHGKQWACALLCVLTFPAQLIYANAVMSEIMLQATVLVMVISGVRYLKNLRLSAFAMTAMASVVALLLKPVFYPFAAIIAVAGLVLGWRARRGVVAAIGLAPALVVLAYMEWNQQRTGYFHFSSITEINLLHYNAAGVVRQLDGAQAEDMWVAGVLHDAQLQPDFAARQRLIHERASDVLWAHPLVYAWQHIMGMAALFLDPGRFDISEFLQLAPLAGGGFLAQVRSGGLWQAVQRLPLGLMTGLAVVLLANLGRLVLAARGFRRLRQGRDGEQYGRWIVLGLLAYVAGLTGPLGAARFLVPVWPLLLGLALAGIKSGVAKLAKSVANDANA
ncbi:hypothetical protein [Hymenobacter daeguensis]